MIEREICLVFGYLPEVDYPHKSAMAKGLSRRFAVVQETYRPDKVDMFFESDFFLALLSLLVEMIPHTRITIRMDDIPEPITTLDGLKQKYAGIDEDERMPPLWVEFMQETQLVGYLETECYIYSGGPHPYSDSYTFSIFLKDYNASVVQAKIEDLCKQQDFNVRDIINGLAKPKISCWTCLKNWVSRL